MATNSQLFTILFSLSGLLHSNDQPLVFVVLSERSIYRRVKTGKLITEEITEPDRVETIFDIHTVNPLPRYLHYDWLIGQMLIGRLNLRQHAIQWNTTKLKNMSQFFSLDNNAVF